ncbi:MAG: ornithine--oxo-acid transaminase [Polyangiaceae bacterium]|nr:ornithine--oxo-acid transaminase [Polyangiaceae bacterium]
MSDGDPRVQIELCERYGARNYAPLDVVLTRGQGCFVWDVRGRRYFDFLSAYSAVSQGHCHPRIVAALVEQAGRLSLTSRAFHNDKMGAMLERIARLTGFEKVLPMNTGAEAVETAIKAMRRFGYEHRSVPEGEAEIVVMSGNFHGRTTTIVGFSDEPAYRHGFGPPTPGFVLAPYGDVGALARLMKDTTVGVLLEPIQGEGGVVIPKEGYLREVRALCHERGVLMALDEVQTGLGRTGKMFAFEWETARPDLLILGKALSGGLYPVSCVCADDEVMRVFSPGSHGSTYGGNPLGAAVAVAALDVVEDEHLAERARALGERALERLRKDVRGEHIKDVRGRGLMIAVEYEDDRAHDVAVALAEAGVLAKDTRRSVVRLMPPLVITEEQLDEALDLALPILAAPVVRG